MPEKDPNLVTLAAPEGLELDWTDEAGRVDAGRELILAPDERALLEAVRSEFATPGGAAWEAEVAGAAIGRLGRLRARTIERAVRASAGGAALDALDEGLTTLEALRATIRERLLTAGDELARADVLTGQAGNLESLVASYRGLGGDLELVRRDTRADMLERELKALAAATDELAVEDFPPRLEKVARAINAVLDVAR